MVEQEVAFVWVQLCVAVGDLFQLGLGSPTHTLAVAAFQPLPLQLQLCQRLRSPPQWQLQRSRQPPPPRQQVAVAAAPPLLVPRTKAARTLPYPL